MKVITIDIETAHRLQEQLQQLHEGHHNRYRNSLTSYNNSSNSYMKGITIDIETAPGQ
jgi:hypothetical protein